MNLKSSILQTARAWLLPLIFLLFGCGSLSGQPGGTPVPEELRGQWQTILSYLPTYFQRGDVPVRDFNGSLGIYFYFWPDGRYEHVASLLLSYFDNNCFRTAEWRERGTVNIAGTDFTFRPARATYIVTDTCGKNEYKDPAQARTTTLSMTPEQDQTGWPMLRMGLPSGEEVLLEKCRTCK
jgi:hypothetical protein